MKLPNSLSPRHSLLLGLVILLTSGASLPADQEHAPQASVQGVFPKVVKLYGSGGLRNLANYGTGLLITPEGHILTVWNHLLDARELLAVLNDGRRYQATFVGGAGEVGLAVLKLESDERFPHFALENIAGVSPGMPILGFSNMFNVAAGNEPVSVIHGIVSAIAPLQARRGGFTIPYENDVIVIDGIVNNSGAAGGALTTYDGRLIGIIGKELRDRRSQLWINYAIPLKDVAETIGKMIAGEIIQEQAEFLPPLVKPVDLTHLGLVMVPNVVARTPAFIDSVRPDSLSARAGLRADDLIVLIDDDLIQSCEDFYRILGEKRPGDRLQITIRRGDNLSVFTLELP